MAALRVLLCLAGASAEWSFRHFLEGEWALERSRAGALTRAYYTLNATDAGIVGRYYEDGMNEEPVNEMEVRVLFDDDAGRMGSFQLAKIKRAESWDAEDDPEPATVSQPQTVFEFAFTPQMNER